MSGRDVIYIQCWHSILQHPFFGWGINFWSHANPGAERVRIAVGWNVGYSECGVLELALQTGFVGVALVLGTMLRACWQGLRLLRTPFYQPEVGCYLAMLVLALASNLDAGWLLKDGTLDWFLIVIACVGLNMASKRAAAARALAQHPGIAAMFAHSEAGELPPAHAGASLHTVMP